MLPKANLYVIDDDEAVRDSLAAQLDSAGFIVRKFASAREFLGEARSLLPGCLISDVRMPELDGLELLDRLMTLGVRFPTVMMTGQGDVGMAVRAMKAGAIDFVEKPFSDEIILECIKRAEDTLVRSQRNDEAAELALVLIALLTEREREVLDGLVAGLPNKTIAYDLGISSRTVEVHRARVMQKLQARSLSQVVRLALAAGINIGS